MADLTRRTLLRTAGRVGAEVGLTALASGAIAGFTVADPFSAVAEAKGAGHVHRFLGDVWHDHACCAITVRQDLVEQRPRAVQALTDGVVAAQAWLDANRVRNLGATTWEVVRHVVVPAIRPNVLAGLRLALGLGWVVLVPAEMLGVTSGLGYAVLNAKDQLAFHHITALIIVIGTIGFALDVVARWVLATPRQRRDERGRS